MMTALIRWTTNFVARIDTMIAQVENHDALADDAIRTVQHNVARARVQLRRVEQDGASLRQRLSCEREATGKWRSRAAQEADDGRAVECLRRARTAEARARDLDAKGAEHDETERMLRSDIQRLEERLVEIRERRNTLRTRQSRAQAVEAMQGAESNLDLPIEDIFDRWEMRLATSEVEGRGAASVDSFADGFARVEEDSELRAELEALRSQS